MPRRRCDEPTEKQYKYLEPRPGSNYRTLWIKGRRIRATVVDEHIHGPDPSSGVPIADQLHVLNQWR
jgi:hypothetical protein